MMKAKFIVAISLLMFSVVSFAQENKTTVNNFAISDDGSIYWQKVFDSEKTFKDVLSFMQNSGEFSGISASNGMITCMIPRTKIDLKNLGYAKNDLPVFYAFSDIECFVNIQFKEGRYRVSIEKICLIENVTASVLKDGKRHKLETLALKKAHFTKQFSGMPSTIYNDFFNEVFLFKEKQILQSDNW